MPKSDLGGKGFFRLGLSDFFNKGQNSLEEGGWIPVGPKEADIFGTF